MRRQYLQSGKIVGTHGVRGMVRIQPWCDSSSVLCGFKKIYLNNGETLLSVEQAKPHGNISLFKIKGIDTIEQAEKLRGSIIYIDRNDYKLEDGAYFIEDLIGMPVFNLENNLQLGILSDVSQTGANDVWHIKNDDKEYLVPKIDDIKAKVDFKNNRIEILPLKGIFDDEDWYINTFSGSL